MDANTTQEGFDVYLTQPLSTMVVLKGKPLKECIEYAVENREHGEVRINHGGARVATFFHSPISERKKDGGN